MFLTATCLAQGQMGPYPDPADYKAQYKRYEELSPQTYRDPATGKSFDAYVSQARRYDQFEEFVAAQNEIAENYRALQDDIEASLNELDRLTPLLQPAKRAVDQLEPLVNTINDAIERISWGLSSGNVAFEQIGEAQGLLDRLRIAHRQILEGAVKSRKAYSELFEAQWQAGVGLHYQRRQLARYKIDYLGNINKNEWFHRPNTFLEVRVESPFGLLYEAKWKVDERIEEIARMREFSEAVTSGLLTEIETIEMDRAPGLKKMRDLEARWQELNDTGVDLVWANAWSGMILEALDVAIAAKTSGPAFPVTLLFEGMHRTTGLAFYLSGADDGGLGLAQDYGVQPVALPDQLLAARQLLAEGGGTNMPDLSNTVRDGWQIGLGLGADFLDSMLGDAKKEAWSKLLDIAKDRRNYNVMRRAINERGYWAVINIAAYDTNFPRTKSQVASYFRDTLGVKMDDAAVFQRLIRGEAGSTLGDAVGGVVGDMTPNELAKTLGTTAAVNLAKLAAQAGFNEARYRNAYEMALIEIDYLRQRNSIQSGFIQKLQIESEIDANRTTLEEKIREIAIDCCKRILEVTNIDAAVIDKLEEEYDKDMPLILRVLLDGRPRDGLFSVGGSDMSDFARHFEAGDLVTEMTVEFPLAALQNANDSGTVDLILGAERTDIIAFDGDPETVAVLDNTTLNDTLIGWKLDEDTIDKTHKLPHVVPRTGVYVTVLDLFPELGMGVKSAPGILVELFDEDGEVTAEARTLEVLDPVFLKASPGRFRLRVSIRPFLSLNPGVCGDFYETEVVLKANEKRRYAAKVVTGITNEGGSSFASKDTTCLVEIPGK